MIRNVFSCSEAKHPSVLEVLNRSETCKQTRVLGWSQPSNPPEPGLPETMAAGRLRLWDFCVLFHC